METIIVGVVLAIVIAVTVYELSTGYAGVRLGFTRHTVSRDDQPLFYWAVIGIKIVVVVVIALSVWGG
jgi:hypothetical protein